jgi:hypothetical protein
LLENPVAPPLTVERARSAPRWSSAAWVPATLGGVLISGGLVYWFHAREVDARLRASDPSIVTQAQLQEALRDGRRYQGAGWVLGSVGAAGLLTAAGLLLFDTPADGPRAIVVPSAQGVSATMEWRL